MRFLNFFFRSTPRAAPADAIGSASGRSEASGERFNVARPANGQRQASGRAAAQDSAQGQQSERAERRELLYGVVRETMMRAGVLSASYKFKVLAVDVRGRQFLVMIDMAHDVTHAGRWSEMEMLMAQAAKARYDLNVTGVYWRSNPQVNSATAPAPLAVTASAAVPNAAPAPMAATAPAMAAAPMAYARPSAPTRPTPLARPKPVSTPVPIDIPVDERTTEPAALTVMERPGRGKPMSRYEPIEADEVAAFKHALAAAGRGGASLTSGIFQRSGARNPAPAGFEDTQIPETDQRAPGLSVTQYGELN